MLPSKLTRRGAGGRHGIQQPGVAADSNGLFHGLGDHAANSSSVDRQPTIDQQSRAFVAAENVEPAAFGQELGDLFQYNLTEKVTILKNHSALVPIINSRIKAEKVTLWSAGTARPTK